MLNSGLSLEAIAIGLFLVTQVLYLVTFLIDGYLFSLPVNTVPMDEAKRLQAEDFPHIVLFYPVLNELEATMRTTFIALAGLDYPTSRYRVIAVPNTSDTGTIASLQRLKHEFPFLEILATPPTSDPSWEEVWSEWDANPKAYWWHEGRRAGVRDLPPKKTRQLIYAFYRVAAEHPAGDFLVNYIDADSAPPRDHFLAAAVGMRHYDVLQSTNIAGNLNTTLPASWHAFDHIAWDGLKYRHLSADGRQPYWVLGKGLFFRASDLIALGGFHPWITIEDPEVGMRFWKNGKRLGIIDAPLIEEVPNTVGKGITQRKRWVCGFFQSLNEPLTRMGFTRGEKIRAWMNFLPCLSLWVNAIGIPIGAWALYQYLAGPSVLPVWSVYLSLLNIVLFFVSLGTLYWTAWKRTALVLHTKRERLWYLVRVNPISLFVYWLLWLAPLWIGWRMFRRDKGLVWERTDKIDANALLVREQQARPAIIDEETPVPPAPLVVVPIASARGG